MRAEPLVFVGIVDHFQDRALRARCECHRTQRAAWEPCRPGLPPTLPLVAGISSQELRRVVTRSSVKRSTGKAHAESHACRHPHDLPTVYLLLLMSYRSVNIRLNGRLREQL